ncbi:BON domain-containing protein, partial [Curvivirga aplysinae]|uniref:BON domain-containing protein n=1 Tax=Curvivirga aplysinae TaxID=2529852 RepID=UPI0012BB60D8
YPMIKYSYIFKNISVILLFLSLSGCVSALEMAFEDRSGDDIATDTQIKTEILAEIADKQGASAAASTSVIVYEQVVLLTGALENSSDRNAVNSIARDTGSVKKVINELTIAKADSSTGDTASDILINQKIHAQAATNSFIRHTNWRWNTVNGTVYLFGRALTQQERSDMRRLVRDIDGVKNLIDHSFVRSVK